MTTLTAQIRDSHAVAHGLRIHYIASGHSDAPLLLFLHGFPEHCGAWRELLPGFAGHWNAVAIDLPGYGLSDKPSDLKAYRAGAVAGVLEAFVRALGYQRCVIVGHDWGGAIGWYLAAKKPGLVAGFVAINAVHPTLFAREFQSDPQQREASRYIALFRSPEAEALLAERDFAYLLGMFENGTGRPGWLDTERAAEYLQAWRRPGALAGGLAYYRASATVHAAGADGRASPHPVSPMTVRVPTLVIWGNEDRFLLVGNLVGLDELVPDLRVECLPQASHWVVHEQPDQVAGLIEGFLQTLPRLAHGDADG